MSAKKLRQGESSEGEYTPPTLSFEVVIDGNGKWDIWGWQALP